MSNKFLADLVETIAQKREPWQKHHHEVMQKYKRADCLSEAADFFLYVLSRLDKSSTPPREKIHIMNLSWADNLCGVYERWYTAAADLLGSIDESEQDEFPVERSDDLRAELQRVGQVLPEMTALRQKITDFRAGTCIPLKDALDGMGNLPSRDGGKSA